MGERDTRILVARLQGVAQRWVHGVGDRAGTAERLQAALDGGPDPDRVLPAAIAELRAVTADPDTLTRAAARYTDDGHGNPWALALFEAAGADVEQARQIWARRGPTWDPGKWDV